MAYERGSGGAGGKSGNESFKKTLAEYTAHYNNKNGFQNKQLDDPYFNSSKPAGSTMRKTPSKNNPNRKPPPTDPYFDSRKPAGNYMGRQGPQPSYAMKEEMGWKWKEQAQWENKIRNPQAPPPGLLPPGTAPDTPNIARQQIENSSLLSDKVKKAASESLIASRYTENPWAGGWFSPSPWDSYSIGDIIQWRGNLPRGNLVMEYNDPTGHTSAHEAIHAYQYSPFVGDFTYPYTESGMSIAADTRRLADEGYRWAQETVDILDNPEDGMYGKNPSKYDALEYQAFNAGGSPHPAEVPPWFREKHFSEIWSPQAMQALPPPRPMVSPIQAPSGKAPSPPSIPRYGGGFNEAAIKRAESLYEEMKARFLAETRMQSKYPVGWR